MAADRAQPLRLFLDTGVILEGCFGRWGASQAADGLVTYLVTPREADPAIARINNPHYVVFDPGAAPSGDLLLFMPGSGGNPANVSDFLNVTALQGYRAVSLSYNDLPAVVSAVQARPDWVISANQEHWSDVLAERTGLRMVTPREFLGRLLPVQVEQAE